MENIFKNINYSKGTLVIGNKNARKEFVCGAMITDLSDYKKLIIINSVDYIDYNDKRLEYVINKNVIITSKDFNFNEEANDINLKVKKFSEENGNKLIVLVSDNIRLSSICDLIPISRAKKISLIISSSSVEKLMETWSDDFLLIAGNLVNNIKISENEPT